MAFHQMTPFIGAVTNFDSRRLNYKYVSTCEHDHMVRCVGDIYNVSGVCVFESVNVCGWVSGEASQTRSRTYVLGLLFATCNRVEAKIITQQIL